MKRLAAWLACSLLSGAASAVVIYDFEGDCAVASDCNGTATGVLTLDDAYTPGTTVTSSDFISLSYSSSQGSFVVPDDLAFIEVFSGVLPEVAGPSVDWVSIDFAEGNSGLNACSGVLNSEINCFTAGWWYVEFFPVGIGDDGGDFNDRDHGTTHTWTLRDPAVVPAPPAIWLLVTGSAGLGLMRRKQLRIRAIAFSISAGRSFHVSR